MLVSDLGLQMLAHLRKSLLCAAWSLRKIASTRKRFQKLAAGGLVRTIS